MAAFCLRPSASQVRRFAAVPWIMCIRDRNAYGCDEMRRRLQELFAGIYSNLKHIQERLHWFEQRTLANGAIKAELEQKHEMMYATTSIGHPRCHATDRRGLPPHAWCEACQWGPIGS